MRGSFIMAQTENTIQFPKVFKTITSDNGSEFSNLTTGLKDVTNVYFARPYAPYERGSNERILIKKKASKLLGIHNKCVSSRLECRNTQL